MPGIDKHLLLLALARQGLSPTPCYRLGAPELFRWTWGCFQKAVLAQQPGIFPLQPSALISPTVVSTNLDLIRPCGWYIICLLLLDPVDRGSLFYFHTYSAWYRVTQSVTWVVNKRTGSQPKLLLQLVPSLSRPHPKRIMFEERAALFSTSVHSCSVHGSRPATLHLRKCWPTFSMAGDSALGTGWMLFMFPSFSRLWLEIWLLMVDPSWFRWYFTAPS